MAFFPSDASSAPLLLHEFFERQAERTPAALAAVDGSKRITYAELARRSDCIAGRLQQLGVRPEQSVGLCLPRSFDLLAAMLGILKSGAVYVPIDPNYPSDRIAYMVENADIGIAIVDHVTRDRIITQKMLLILIDELDNDKSTDLSRSTYPISPDALAYVMYTSGSTGKPKGVMIEHRHVAQFIAWTAARFTSGQFSWTLCANSVSFDVSIFEIFATFAAGGVLVIVKNILDLLTHTLPCPISTIIAAPSSLAEIVRAKALPVSIDTLIFGGERLPLALIRELYDTTRVREIINSWGVTEDTIGSAFFTIPRDQNSEPPMGKPLPGRYLYLLDSQLQPVPIGTTGEIFCGGYGVARGYLGDPKRNAERFLPNPFGDSHTMYRTGDLAFKREDTAFFFVGREDQQIKLHGFRIELGEIEAVLETNPAVKQAAVIAQFEKERLVMYIVPSFGFSPTRAELQAYLAERLPTHMIPGSMQICETIPFGPTGKLDRRALEAMTLSDDEPDASPLVPTTATAAKIAECFAEILGLKQVGIDQDFFRLGGKSLTAARLLTEIKQAFPQEVGNIETLGGPTALHTAFAFRPTVAFMSAILERTEPLPERQQACYCIQSGSAAKAPLFLFHGVVNGEALYCYELARALGHDQPLYALAPHGVGGSSIPATIEAMARDYITYIQNIQPQGPYHIMGYCNGGLVAFETAKLLRAQGQAVDTLLLIATPGHNVRNRLMKKSVHIIKKVLRLNQHAELRLFLKTRDATYFTKYFFDYIIETAQARLFRKRSPSLSPTERLNKLRSMGQQSENARFRKIMQAAQAYVPDRYDGSICIIWGSQDGYLQHYNPHNDWKRISSKFHLEYVDGDHHFLNENVTCLVEHFSEC